MDTSKYFDSIVKTMQELIQIKTVKDTSVLNGPFGQGNKECLEKALKISESLGFKVKNLDGYCGYAEIGEGEELIGIIGHLDVVPEGDGWKYPPYSAKIVDNVMYGRGTWDDKGPTVIALYALKALMDDGFKFNKRVRVIFGCDEESGSKCIEHYLKTEGQIDYGFSPDADFPVIYGEKTINLISISGTATNNGTVKLISLNAGIVSNAVPDIATFTISYQCDKCKERALNEINKYFDENNIKYEYEILDSNLINYTVHGKAAHGSIPQFGVNAASFAICAIAKACDNSFTTMYAKYINVEHNGKSLGCYAHDEYGDIVVNIGIVTYQNDEFKVLINSRLPFNTNSDLMFSQIKETLKNEDNVNVTLINNSNGFIMDKNSDMIKCLLKAYQSVTGDYESKPLCIAGGTYARSFNNCVAFGPELKGFGDILIHQPNECINLAAIDTIMKIYTKAIASLVSEVSFKK